MARAREVVAGKARIEGRSLAEWVPEVVRIVVAACDPVEVVLFGSVARGDDGPDSDIDLLVAVDDAVDRQAAATAALRAVASLPPEVDVVTVTAGAVAARRDVPGTVVRPALERERWCTDVRAEGPEVAFVEPPVFAGADLDVLGRLSDWAITQRYPADQPDPGPDDVAEALAFGPRALAAIEARLARGGG